MRFVFASYVYVNEFNNPTDWLNRIEAFAGILSALAKQNEVHSIQQIDFQGSHQQDMVTYHFKHYTQNELKFFPLRLNFYLKKLKPDVIIIQGLHCPFQVLQLRLVVGPKVKIILQHRAEKPFKGYKKLLQQLADHYIDAYLFGSKILAQEWLKHRNLKSEKKIFEVAGLSSKFHRIDKAIALKHTKAVGSPIFLWVGRLNANKDPITVLEGFLRFTATHPLAQLYMFFQTEELLPKIKEMLANHINGKKINLLGNIPHPNLLYWFNAADYLLSGSHYEGGGTVLCESMSVGCVPIVTAIPSFQMITNNGACGFLYEPGNIDALVKVLENTQFLAINEQQEKCIKFFNAHLSFEAIGAKIHEIGSLA